MTYPRFASFTRADRPGYGLVAEGGVIDFSARPDISPPTLRMAIEQQALPRLLQIGACLPADFPVEEISFAIPIPDPEKVICVGVNYPERNEEYRDGRQAAQYPSLFVRFARSFTGHQSAVIRPRESRQFDYEGEIAIIVGKAGRRICEAAALSHIAGLSLCNEATLRDWVRHGRFNVTQGKNFDRSGAIGPWLVPFFDEAQLADIQLETRVNGAVRQRDRTSRMIFSFRKLIGYISTFTTLVPGDIIVTGTPAGAGARHDPPVWLQPGDIVEVEAEGIGCLCNPIADEI